MAIFKCVGYLYFHMPHLVATVLHYMFRPTWPSSSVQDIFIFICLSCSCKCKTVTTNIYNKAARRRRHNLQNPLNNTVQQDAKNIVLWSLAWSEHVASRKLAVVIVDADTKLLSMVFAMVTVAFPMTVTVQWNACSPNLAVISWVQDEKFYLIKHNEGGRTVSYMVEALCYKPEGRGFKTLWGHCKVFNLSNPSGRTMVLRFTRPLTEMSIRSRKIMFLGNRERPVRRDVNLTAFCGMTV
jgi:hypothetical protein